LDSPTLGSTTTDILATCFISTIVQEQWNRNLQTRVFSPLRASINAGPWSKPLWCLHARRGLSRTWLVVGKNPQYECGMDTYHQAYYRCILLDDTHIMHFEYQSSQSVLEPNLAYFARKSTCCQPEHKQSALDWVWKYFTFINLVHDQWMIQFKISAYLVGVHVWPTTGICGWCSFFEHC